MRNEGRLSCVLVVLFFFVAVGLGLWKLATLSYNALDLGIFQQVVAQTARGHLFGMSIHPHLYLGDHIEPFLLLLVPFYWIATHPGTLLVLQAAAVAFAAWPLYLLARDRLPSPYPLFLVALYTGSIAIQSLTMFEFHELPFALLPLFLAIRAYTKGDFGKFLFFLVATLMIREDVGLVLLGFGLLAWAERRSLIWRWWPTILGLAWFAGGTFATSLFNHEQYKFLAYYGWLGGTVRDIVLRAVTHPWIVAARLFRPVNLLFLLVATLLMAGLPLFRSRRLLPALFVAVALFLTGTGADGLTFRTHYPALFLPFLFWASIEGFVILRDHPPAWTQRLPMDPAPVAAGLVIVISLYASLTLGPFRPAAIASFVQESSSPATAAAKAMAALIPEDAHVAVGYRFLPSFGQHDHLFSLHYVFSGRRQLSTTPYVLPEDTDWILYDAADYLFYTIQFEHDPDKFLLGDDRLRDILAGRSFGLVSYVDTFIVFQRGAATSTELFRRGDVTGRAVERQTPESKIPLVAIGGQDETLQTETIDVAGTPLAVLPIRLTFQANMPLDRTYFLRVEYVDAVGRIRYTRSYPLAYGLWPTTEWRTGEAVTTTYRWAVPRLPKGEYTVRASVLTERGYLTLDPKLSAEIAATEQQRDGSPYTIGKLAL